ncbi:MAG: hypothetical protein KGL39_23585 [Patescibacteria group bacterium]|nr:hypothetical protein [Patescibacteria group bacterium]
MNDITGFGLKVILTASNTFPAGLVITQFADDSDPLDIAAIKIADTAMGLNGDGLKWSRAVMNPMVLNVIPNSDDDTNLSILANANRVSQGNSNARDIITAVLTYPDGTVVTLNQGFITDAPFGSAVSSAGRLKTKTYSFSFSSNTGSN